MLFQFVREALQNDWLPFELRASGGQKLEENEALALNECGLVSWGCAHGITPLPGTEWEGPTFWTKLPLPGCVWRCWAYFVSVPWFSSCEMGS